jgi:hypothetical protein
MGSSLFSVGESKRHKEDLLELGLDADRFNLSVSFVPLCLCG